MAAAQQQQLEWQPPRLQFFLCARSVASGLTGSLAAASFALIQHRA